MLNQKYRVGIIGYGLSAKVFHIPYIQANSRFELRAIVQRSGDEAQTQHPECTVYKSASALFVDENIDVVVISTPPPTHFDLASQALNHGKHVVIEKPFCPSSEECDQLIALAKARGKHLTVFQNRRWDADFVTLCHIVSQNQLGRIVEFESHFDRYDPSIPPRDVVDSPGSGVIYDLGTHLIDQALQIYGPPTKVTGFLGRQRSGINASGPQDSCTILLHYETGLLVTVKASPLSADEKQLRFWVRGEQGSFKKYGLDPQEPQLIAGMKISDPAFGTELSSEAGILTIYKNGKANVAPFANLTPPTYQKFYDGFAQALDGDGSVPVAPEGSRNVIRLIELARESADAGATISLGTGDFIAPA